MDRGAWQATVHGVAESDTIERFSHTNMEEMMPINRGIHKHLLTQF